MNTQIASQLESISTDIESLKKENNTFSNYRLILLVFMLVCIVLAYKLGLTAVVLTFGAFIAAFYFLVKKHQGISDSLFIKEQKKLIFENEISVANGHSSVYSNGESFDVPNHSFTNDLDVFGEGSLFSLLNRGKTPTGKQKLANSLLGKAKANIEEVQEAVNELELDWSYNFLGSMFNLSEEEATEAENLKNLPALPDLKLAKLLKILVLIGPFLWILVGFAIYKFPNYWFVLVLLFAGFNFALTKINKKITEPIFLYFKKISKPILSYKLGVDQLLEKPWQSKLMKENKALVLTNDSKNPIVEFYYIVQKLELRNNQFASFFMYLLYPFDTKQYFKLQRWVAENPNVLSNVFEAIGNTERLISLATLKWNNPEYVFPALLKSTVPYVNALELSHPLIPKQEQVGNTFELNKNNRISIITGSNMSGKSTFLRTLGSNIVLAYAGTVVAAQQLSLNEGINLVSYMRIKDSLQQNVSTFKAEINRVKIILDRINDPNTLFLIDEMLRGTNSDDKLKGSLALIKKLAHSTAYTLLATHDLRTTDLQVEFSDVIKNYYFEYDLDGGNLTFDYKIKEGVCKSFNASELLKQIGLPI